jgi:hypothetical protein
VPKIYGNHLISDTNNNINTITSRETIEMSNMLDIEEIKTQCQKVLCSTIKIEENNSNDNNNDNNKSDDDNYIDVSDILYMLSLAERYSCNYLINKLMAYLKIQVILDNTSTSSDKYLDLSNYDLSDIIKDNIMKMYNDEVSLVDVKY